MEFFKLRNKADKKAEALGLYTDDEAHNAKIRELLFTLCFDFDDYIQELLKDTEFHQGARAMFDYFQMKDANYWHGNPEVDAQMAAESEIAMAWITEAFEEVSPSDYKLWKDIGALQHRVRELEAKIKGTQEEA